MPLPLSRLAVERAFWPVLRPVGSRRRRPAAAAGRLLGVLALLGLPLWGAAQTTKATFAVLVFSKTAEFRHDSIADGIAAIRALGAEHGFAVDATEDAGRFTDAALARYKVVVFLLTTGDVLDPPQKAALERYVRGGGGFVGIHSASDTEHRWPWYGRLIGTWFKNHPRMIQRATVRIEDPDHPSTMNLPQNWERTDEWYNFLGNPRGAVHILARIDEGTYFGGAMGADHPIAWCRNVDRGRSWYTAMGHTRESYAEPLFRRHLLGGIESAAGVAAGCPPP
jgi:type 1 glutamine amidotransferase